jgi:hypothetical protein
MYQSFLLPGRCVGGLVRLFLAFVRDLLARCLLALVWWCRQAGYRPDEAALLLIFRVVDRLLFIVHGVC